MSLPIYNSAAANFSTMQTNWAQQLNPLTTNPSLKCSILQNVLLNNGSNTINHLLGRKLQGWRIVRQRALASIYDTQDTNIQPALTLILVSNAAVSCDIEVF